MPLLQKSEQKLHSWQQKIDEKETGIFYLLVNADGTECNSENKWYHSVNSPRKQASQAGKRQYTLCE